MKTSLWSCHDSTHRCNNNPIQRWKQEQVFQDSLELPTPNKTKKNTGFILLCQVVTSRTLSNASKAIGGRGHFVPYPSRSTIITVKKQFLFQLNIIGFRGHNCHKYPPPWLIGLKNPVVQEISPINNRTLETNSNNWVM